MNDQRRTRMAFLMSRIAATSDHLNAKALELRQYHHDLNSFRIGVRVLLEEEQAYLDNMPEAFQASEHGDQAQAAIDAMDGAYVSLSQAMDKLDAVLIIGLPGAHDMLMSTMESLTAAKK